jgi:non-homologous end joining protein Ku
MCEKVAVKLDDEWILSRVKAYNIQTGMYTVIDADDNTKNYTVSEAQTVVLEGERIGKVCILCTL